MTATTPTIPQTKKLKIPSLPNTYKIACLGGGQLGRMLALEAPRLNLNMSFLDPAGTSCPAAYASGHSSIIIQGSLQDKTKVKELVNASGGCDVVTCEMEHINTEVLIQLENEGVCVRPSGRIVKIIQDKLLQKNHFQRHGIPVPKFKDIPSLLSIKQVTQDLGLPIMLKSRRGGYDGRGNFLLKDNSKDSIHNALQSLGVQDVNSTLDLYAEQYIPFRCEVAVMVVRSIHGETRAYPAVTGIQSNHICRVVLAPARNIPSNMRTKCQEIAMKAIESLGEGAVGVFGVELFLGAKDEEDNTILLNEVAPRPHNSGHYTQDACAVSQFENHLRAICGLELGGTEMSVGAAAMINILGANSETVQDTMSGLHTALTIPHTTVHWYGKHGCRSGRKVGHINVTANSYGELDFSLSKLLQNEQIPLSILPKDAKLNSSPLVSIIMGSQSDLPSMQAAVIILKQFNIPYEVDIVSAHRTPDKLVSYSRSATTRGLQVIIAGAGGAAHLPGMVAAMTPLPVVGVPIKTSTLNGYDSLLSIVQMPPGIPVATVAIGNAKNAGLLAVRILCGSRPELQLQMENYQREMKETVEDMSQKLVDLGSELFLQGMENQNNYVNI